MEENCRDLREKLEESKEMVETLEFQIMEYETDVSMDDWCLVLPDISNNPFGVICLNSVLIWNPSFIYNDLPS